MATNCEDLSVCPEMDFFMNESESDVVFVIDGQRLPALKSILRLKSRGFRAMFSQNYKESKEKEVVIEDTTFEAFKIVIQFLYCERLVLRGGKDFELIEEICKLSDRYEIPKIFDIIGNHLKTTKLTFDNLYLVSRICFDHKIKDLMPNVLTFIDNNYEEFVGKDMKDMSDFKGWTHLLKIMAQKYNNLKIELSKVNNGLKDELIGVKSKVEQFREKFHDEWDCEGWCCE